MLYWLFTEGRELFASMIFPLLCLSLLLPPLTAALLGAGIQRAHAPHPTGRILRGVKVAQLRRIYK